MDTILDKEKEEELFKKSPALRRYYVFRDTSFDIQFAKFRHTDEGKLAAGILNFPEHGINIQKFSSRVINHWEKLGLVNSERDGEKGWRKYSLIDLIWLNIIYELREFGFSLKKIVKMKSSLEILKDRNTKSNPSKFPLLEFYVSQAYHFKKPIRLIIFRNGELHPVTFDEYLTTKELFILDNHFSLDLNRIIQEAIPNVDISPVYDPVATLDPHEVKVMEKLRVSNANKIDIYKDKNAIRIDSTEWIPVKEEDLHELIKQAPFQGFKFSVNNGKIDGYQRTLQDKFDLNDTK